MIVEPWVDLSTLPALPALSVPEYLTVEDIQSVAFHFAKPASPVSPGALMFNLIEIDGPAGMEQGFLMAWPPRGEFKLGDRATISTVLHQRMLPAASIKAFNRAELTSAEEYVDGIERFEEAFPRAERKLDTGASPSAKPPIRSHLGLFKTLATTDCKSAPPRKTMKAMVAREYGPPSVMRAEDVPVPYPGPGQIRVKVIASSINPLDVKMRSGDVRHIYPALFPEVYGYSVAGIVDAIGTGVTTRLLGEGIYASDGTGTSGKS